MIIYQDYAKEILAKLHRISKIINHNLSSGTYHETILKSYLKNFLSKRFSVKTGFIRNPELGQSSNQIDILIIDENTPSAYLFQEDDFAIVLPHSVVCAIEVKTNFNKESFLDITKKAKNFREICGMRRAVFHAFCFTNNVANRDTISGWYRELDTVDNILFYPKSIYVLDSYVIQAMPDPMCIPEGAYFFINEKQKDINEEIILADFLLNIIKSCEFHTGHLSSDTVSNYFEDDYDGLFEIKHTGMQYKTGKVELEKLQGMNGEVHYSTK